MLMFTISDYTMKATLQFLGKKEKRMKIIIHCYDQSKKHTKFTKNELETLHTH